MNKVSAIILAAGCGNRMQLDVTKQRLVIAGESVLSRAVRAFDNSPSVTDIILVVKDDEIEFAKAETSSFKKVRAVVAGGKTRCASAKIGFSKIPSDSDYVAIHDGARCLITPSMIEAVVSDAIRYGAATASSLVTDTVKEVDENGFIRATLDRRTLRNVQTPQIFKADIYKKALAGLDENDSSVTDDNMLVERLGVSVYCTDTGKNNIKITTVDDIMLVESMLQGGKTHA